MPTGRSQTGRVPCIDDIDVFTAFLVLQSLLLARCQFLSIGIETVAPV